MRPPRSTRCGSPSRTDDMVVRGETSWLYEGISVEKETARESGRERRCRRYRPVPRWLTPRCCGPGSRARDDTSTAPGFVAPVVTFKNPPALLDPAGSGVLGAVAERHAVPGHERLRRDTGPRAGRAATQRRGRNRDGVAGRPEPGRRYAEGDRDGQACHLARHRRAFEVARIDVLITIVG